MSSSRQLRKPPRYLGMTALAVGAFFLFDPFVGIFDLLPDAIGYLLFAIGLYRLSDMDDRLGEASRAAGKLALLGVGRTLAMLLSYTVVSGSERPVFILLMLFSLGVLDLLMVIPMWKNLSGGFLYLGSRTDATALFGHSADNPRSYCERYAGFSTCFFILRELAAVLPEMTVLTHEQGGTDWGGNSLYNFVGLFRLAGVAVSLLVGLLWLVMTIRFIHKIKSDKPFLSSLHRKYETEVLSRPDLFAMRAIKASLVCLSAAAVLSLDLYVEGVSILPDLLSAVLMVLSIKFLSRYTQKSHKPAMAVSILYGVAALVAWLMQIFFFSFNDLPAVSDKPVLQERLGTVTGVQIVTSVLFFCAYLLILRLLYDLVRRHTGLKALREGSTYAEERTQAIHTHIRKKLVWVGVFAALSAISAVLLWGVIPTISPIDLPIRPTSGDAFFVMLYDGLREAYWLVDLCIGGGLIATTIHAGSEIFEQMDYSYLMN